jgi:hypothetical protein
MTDPAAVYGWLEGRAEFDAYCVSVTLGLDGQAVADAFQVDPATMRAATFAEQLELAAPYPDGFGNDTVGIDRLGDAVIALQANGWAGVDEACATLLSQRGRHVGVYRSVNADMQLVVAEAGTILRTFDPLLYDAAGAMDEEAGLPFGHPGRPDVAAFALLERLTGVCLTRDWVLETRHPTYRRNPDL